jgi:hypothetical protein
MLLQSAAYAGSGSGCGTQAGDVIHPPSRLSGTGAAALGRNTAALRAALGNNNEALLNWFYEQV